MTTQTLPKWDYLDQPQSAYRLVRGGTTPVLGFYTLSWICERKESGRPVWVECDLPTRAAADALAEELKATPGLHGYEPGSWLVLMHCEATWRSAIPDVRSNYVLVRGADSDLGPSDRILYGEGNR